MRSITCLAAILLAVRLFGQGPRAEDFGFRHLQTIYKGDTVDILIKSRKGDEQKKKPLFLFCQGSLPIPLIITYKDSGSKVNIYNVFVFNPDSLSDEYHLVIIGKPSVPLAADQNSLNRDLTYSDGTGKYPKNYIDRNLPDYYVNRNIAVIKFLQGQPWVAGNRLVVAGHSEGSTIAARMAYSFPKVTQLIYSGGNPFGRIVTMIGQQRVRESEVNKYGEMTFDKWKMIIDDPANMEASNGDANGATYGFSVPPPIEYLEKLKIPVLVTYGTKDIGCPFNDYLRVRMMEQKRTNFTFKAYIGVEHNFFPLKANGEIDYDVFNWDKVAGDWSRWLAGQ